MCFMKYEVCQVGFFVTHLTESCGLRKRNSWYNSLKNEEPGDRLKFLFSPDIILLWLTGLKAPTDQLTQTIFCRNISVM